MFQSDVKLGLMQKGNFSDPVSIFLGKSIGVDNG
ncbi:hypothetical protein LYNGBM3L_19900 [Moorena producens 3L]|uniref:Uncharacterized protein n=1 Tax=Moorena producens 3L TaxID=489825 RepID=F4XNM7_9CYAN|nr:hypothetical protein LYNGBM3L_19900 [Moorena producens 3L]